MPYSADLGAFDKNNAMRGINNAVNSLFRAKGEDERRYVEQIAPCEKHKGRFVQVVIHPGIEPGTP